MILVILWILATIVWFIWSIVPALPGPALSYVWLLLLHFSKYNSFSRTFLIIWALIIVASSVLDYIIPTLWVKKFWWTKRWDRWSTIWLIFAVIVLPFLGITMGPFWLFWLIWGPFLWAYIGEKFYGKSNHHALKSAFWTFIWFLAGTFLKIAISVIMSIYIFIESYHIFFQR